MSSQRNHNSDRNLIFYFQVHQPKRLRTMRFFDIGNGSSYFNTDLDRDIIQRVARECYLPANALLLRLIKKNPQIKVAFSVSGIIIDQLEEHAPEVLESFRALAETGSVEFLAETYYHSLACIMPGNELELQVLKHQAKILEHFGVRATVFRNTELIYNNDIGQRIGQLGYRGVFTDGVEKILGDRTAHNLYAHPTAEDVKVFLRSYRLSDDIAFRFAQPGNKLTAEKYMGWLDAIPAHENLINLAMDYETFGEHQKKETGIFSFMESLFTSLANSKRIKMLMPTEAIDSVKPAGQLSVPNYISWADQERDLSAWLGNEIQRDAFDTLLKLEQDVKLINDPLVTRVWRSLQTSDHFYYMSTKKGNDGNVHNYFSPYPSPYEAFINYMNVLSDFTLQVNVMKSIHAGKAKKKVQSETEALVEQPALY